MFKVGDKVRRTEVSHDPRLFGSMDVIYTLKSPTGNRYEWSTLEGKRLSEIYIEKVIDPIEEAKATLEAAGYTITPPPEKKKGNVYICQEYNGGLSYLSHYDYDRLKGGKGAIAIVDWTEGDGLE